MQNHKLKLKDFQGKRIAILGIGDENIALFKYLKDYCPNITICDQKQEGELKESLEKLGKFNFSLRLGPDYLKNLTDFNIIFRAPGLPYLNEKLQKAKKAGVEISSQIKLFFDLCQCPIIGVTGTKGKGTTSTLIYEILKSKSQISNLKSQIFLGGNIGNPPIEFLDKLTKNDIVILELSSFQLQDMTKSPHIAVILDIKVDHLDYHKDKIEYIEAKQNIVKYQGNQDYAIICADYFTSIEFAALTKAKVYWFSRRKSVDQGAFVNQNQFILQDKDVDNLICQTNEVILRGEHNLENICAAITASYLAGATIESIQKTVKSFKGLEHRLEFVKEIDDRKFYNDSFSTTPDTSIAAIKSFKEPIILLLGGSEKKADYQELGKEISKSSVKAIISIGKTSARIIQTIKDYDSIDIYKDILDINQAVKKAFEISKPGDVILLSPASASFDRFKNYKDRGNQFKEKVMSL